MQAETLASAYRLWRRNWKGKGREYTAGALVWQVSDFPIPIPMDRPGVRPREVVLSSAR